MQLEPRDLDTTSTSHPLAVGFAVVVLAVVCGLFTFNNLAGFFGFPSFGPMTMYSGIRTTSDNHFLMPKLSLGDADVYVAVERLDIKSGGSEPGQQFRALTRYVNEERRLLHLNVVRWHVSRTCRSSADVSIRLVLRPADGDRRQYDDACQAADLQRYELLSSYPPCGPSGCIHLRRYLRDAQ